MGAPAVEGEQVVLAGDELQLVQLDRLVLAHRLGRVDDQQHLSLVPLDPRALLLADGAAGQGHLVDLELLAHGGQLVGCRRDQVDPDQRLRLGADL
jgi:hypothetical protein